MERSSITVIDDDRCNNIRWKGLFVDAPWDPNVQHGNDRAYWCHKTQQCMGPDGKVVDDYECNPFRRCYEEL
ncbi:MAG: hypothetical protein JNK48_09070 [Bryobacterales bacterium]|nr:hypothetical protein [Bryobacterales bacterium]